MTRVMLAVEVESGGGFRVEVEVEAIYRGARGVGVDIFLLQ